MEQNRELRNRPTYSQLTFEKGAKTIQWSKENLFKKWCCDNWTSICKRMNVDTDLTPFIKINSKCITDVNVKCKMIKLLEGNIENLDDIGCWAWQWLFRYYTKTMIHEILDKMDSLKWKTALQKTISRELEDKPQTGRKHLQKTQLRKDHYPNYTKNS